MFNSLRSRLWLTYLVLIGVVLVVMALVLLLYIIRNPRIDRQALERLDLAANVISRQVRENQLRLGEGEGNFPRLEDWFSARVVIVDSDGRETVDSAPEAAEVNWGRLIRSISPRGRLTDAQGQNWLYSLRSLPGDRFLVVLTQRQGGWRLLGTPRIWALFREEFLPPFIRLGIGVSLIALLLSLGMTRWISQPLHKITEAADQVAAGNYQSITPSGPEEVVNLARAFNEMITRVKDTQESQQDFVANVSHELKTPLTSIQGFGAAIRDGTASTPEEIDQAAGIIVQESGRMHRMVMELLELARLDAGTAEIDRQALNLRALLREVTRGLKIQARRAEVTLEENLQPLPTCVGDRDRLVQVLVNLLDNAIQHTPPGGRVIIKSGTRQGKIIVQVIDTGEGIPPEELPRILERFYQVDKSRTKQKASGSGLGLAISKEIVEAHGGRIQVESELGRGSRFVVELPAVHGGDDTVESPPVGEV